MKGRKLKLLVAAMALCVTAAMGHTEVVHAGPASTTVGTFEIGHTHGAASKVSGSYASSSGGCYTKEESYQGTTQCQGFSGAAWQDSGKWYVTCTTCNTYWQVPENCSYQKCTRTITTTLLHYKLNCSVAEGTIIGKVNVAMNVSDYTCKLTPSFTAEGSSGYVSAVTYSWDDGSTGSRTITGNGTYTLTVSYKDNGISQTKTFSVPVSTYDSENPQITGLEVSPKTFTNGNVSVTVSATDNTEVASYRIGTGNWQTSHILTVEENGTYAVYARDIYGNISDAYSVTVSNIDRTAPVISVSVPESYSNTSITVTYSATDDNSAAGDIRYAVSKISSLSAEEITGSETSYTAAENGTYYVYAKDEAGNVAKKAFTITKIDREAPIITIEPLDSTWTKDAVTISYSATDNSNDTIWYAVSKNADLNANQIVGTLTSYSVSENGIYYVYAKDRAGNIAKKEVEVTKIDREAPVITVSSVTDQWTNKDITVTYSAEDNSHDTIFYAVSGSSSLSAEEITGTKTSFVASENGTYYVYAKDLAGNVAKEKVMISKIDKEAPTLTVNPVKDVWTNTDIEITFSAADNSNDTIFYAVSDSSALSAEEITGTATSYLATKNGTYYVYARDLAGNVTKKSVTISRIDKEAPVITVNPIDNKWVKDSITITYSATDNSNDTIFYAVSTNDSLTSDKITGTETSYTVTENGTYFIYAKDLAGNIAKEKVVVGQIDREAPVLTVNPISDEWTKGPVTISYSATDDSNDTITYAVSDKDNLAAGEITSTETSYTVTENGTYYVYAKDLAGNIAKKQVVVSKIDKEAPVITVNPIPDEWTNKDIEISFSATDNSKDKLYYAVSTSDNLAADEITGTETSYRTSENGTYFIYAKDLAGNVAKQSVVISKIDREAPVIVIDPISAKWVNDQVTVTFSATDNSNDTIAYVVSEKDNLSAAEINGTETSFTATGNGTYYVYAKDLAGNIAKKAVEITTIDKEAPVITLNDYSKEYTSEAFTISVTVTDNSNGTIYTAISMMSTLAGDEITGTDTSFSILDNGTYYIYAKDEAGNVANIKVAITNFDKEPPKFDITETNDGSYPDAAGTTWTKSVTATIKASDNVALHEKAYRYEASAEYEDKNSHVYDKNGTYAITVRDAVGNATDKNITIDSIDEVVPVINSITKVCTTEKGEIITVAGSDTEPSSTLISLKVDASDAESGINGLRYKRGGDDFSEWQTSYTVADLKFNGTYTIEVRDKCGNTSSATVTISNLLEQTLVTYQDVTNDGKVLGEKKVLKAFNTAVSGSDLGMNTATGAYYEGYDYVSCDTAVVTAEGTVVHRYFKLHTIKVKYYDENGKLLEEKETPWGGSSSTSRVPNKPAKKDGDYIISYEFVGWGDAAGNLLDLHNIKEDMSVFPVFKEIRKQNVFTVIFMADGKVISTQKVAAGEDAIAPDAPKIEGCEFKMWDRKYTHVTSDITVQALYNRSSFGQNTDIEKTVITPPYDYPEFDITALSKDVEYIYQSYEKPAESETEVKEDTENKTFTIKTPAQEKHTVLQQVKEFYTNKETKTIAITTTAVVGTVGIGALAAYILYAVAGISLLQLIIFTSALIFKKRRYVKGAWMTDEAYVQYVDKFGRKLTLEFDGATGTTTFTRKGKQVYGIDVTELIQDMQKGKLTYAEFEDLVKSSDVYTSFNKNLEIEVSNVKASNGYVSRKAHGFSLTRVIRQAFDVAGDYKIRICNEGKALLFDLKYEGTV